MNRYWIIVTPRGPIGFWKKLKNAFASISKDSPVYFTIAENEEGELYLQNNPFDKMVKTWPSRREAYEFLAQHEHRFGENYYFHTFGIRMFSENAIKFIESLKVA